MDIKKILLIIPTWLHTQFPKPAFRLPPWVKQLKISDDLLRAALLVGGFVLFIWGLWDIAPWLGKIIGGLLLMWFAWPADRGR